MTQEEKQELIIALCGYLPYKCKGKYEIVRILESETKIERFDDELDSNVLDYDFENENFKPYLRSLFSMTEEEKKELSKKYVWNIWTGQIQIRYHSQGCWDDETECPTEEYIILFDWLNKHHFDYRGLIKKGLALEAPEEMYNTKTE